MTSSPSSISARIGKKMIGLPPGTTHTFSGPTVMPRVSLTCFASTSRKSGISLRRPVMRPALIERLLGRLDDVLRRVEIGLADLQVNDAAALRLQRAGLHQNLERGLDAGCGPSVGLIS